MFKGVVVGAGNIIHDVHGSIVQLAVGEAQDDQGRLSGRGVYGVVLLLERDPGERVGNSLRGQLAIGKSLRVASSGVQELLRCVPERRG